MITTPTGSGLSQMSVTPERERMTTGTRIYLRMKEGDVRRRETVDGLWWIAHQDCLSSAMMVS